MRTSFLFILVVILFLCACSPPLPVQVSPVAAAEITSYVTKTTDVQNEADLPWVEIKDVYQTKFDNGESLYVGYSWVLVRWLTWSDGGYYHIGTLKPGESAINLPITFFHPGEIAIIEKDGEISLYFKFVEGKVYIAKAQ